MAAIGALTGVALEARCLAGLAGVRVALSAADPVRAEREAAALVAGGAAALVSVGLAGALADGLAPGTLLLPEHVCCEDGTVAVVDPAWRAHIRSAIVSLGFVVGGGAIAASRAVIATPEAKRALARRTGAVAVDMESGAVARAGRPFLVLRAVADPADRAIPPAALAGVGPDGRVRPWAVAARLLASPGQLPALLRLARDSRAGTAALGAVLRALGSLDPPPPGAAPPAS